MERKIQPLIFVGYYEDVKAYRLFDSNFREALFQRDVEFDEHYPLMEPPSPASPSLPNTSSSPLEDYVSFEEDPNDDPPFPALLDFHQVPKWARAIVDVAWKGHSNGSHFLANFHIGIDYFSKNFIFRCILLKNYKEFEDDVN